MRIKAQITLVLAILILIPLGCNNTYSFNPTATPTIAPTPTQTQIPSPTPVPIFTIGDEIKIGRYKFVVLGWENVDYTGLPVPYPGNKFIAVELVIVNSDPRSGIVLNMDDMFLDDMSGHEYEWDFGATAPATLNERMLDGSLNPGEKMRGKVGFQVPVNIKGLRFLYKTINGQAIVELPPQPRVIEPPIRLTGEEEQPTYVIGNLIGLSQAWLTVNDGYKFDDPKFPPPAGVAFTWYDVRVKIENVSYEDLTISTWNDFCLKDATGRKYTVYSSSVDKSDQTMDRVLAANEIIEGDLFFQIPRNARGLTLIYEPGYINLEEKVLISVE